MNDLAELFSRDPLQLSSQDIDIIIARFREARANFNLTGKGAPKATKEKAKVESINLDDLLG